RASGCRRVVQCVNLSSETVIAGIRTGKTDEERGPSGIKRDGVLNCGNSAPGIPKRGICAPGIDTRLEAVQLDPEIVALGRRGRRERDGLIEVAQRPVAATQAVVVTSTPRLEKCI